MYTSFYIENYNLDECKSFIRTLPSARFFCNPIPVGNKYNICLNLTVEDCNKLNILLNKYYDEEKMYNTPIKKESLFSKIFKYIKKWKLKI